MPFLVRSKSGLSRKRETEGEDAEAYTIGLSEAVEYLGQEANQNYKIESNVESASNYLSQ
jgi:Ser/Thr protein kinase RdoA (MazF antagonist)